MAARHTTALTHHNASSVTADLLGASALGGGYTAQATPLAALGKASEARALVIALRTCLGAVTTSSTPTKPATSTNAGRCAKVPAMTSVLGCQLAAVR